MSEFDEFESAVKRVIRDVSFDQNHDVSVFETNIRVLGFVFIKFLCIFSNLLEDYLGVM